jgi:hypothetical protein
MGKIGHRGERSSASRNARSSLSFPVGLLGSDERGGARDGDVHIIQTDRLRIRRHVGIAKAAGSSHQIHDDLVRDPHDDVIAHVRVADLGGSIVSENGEAALDARNIFGVVIDQQVYVFGEARSAVRDDGKSADEHIARASGVQRAAESDDVLGLRRSRVRRIVSVIQESASAKLEKR